MTDTYSKFALPHEVIEAVQAEEARLTGRLADLPYEVTGALVTFRRAMFPMLTHLAYAVDPEGEPTVEWTRDYVARRAKQEADVIVESATSRAAQGLAFAASHFKAERDALHKRERYTSVQQNA